MLLSIEMMGSAKDVDDETPSIAISQNIGFKTVDENTEEYIMVCDLYSYLFSVTPAYGRIDR